MIIIITKNMPILTDYFQSQLCECHCGFMVGDAPHDVWVGFCLARHCYISRQITFCHVYIICLSVRVQPYVWFESDIVGIGGGVYVFFFHCFLTLNDCHSILSLNFQIIKCINTQSCFILSTYVVFNAVTQCLCSHRILSSQMHCKTFAFRDEGVSCSPELCVVSFYLSISAQVLVSVHSAAFSFSLPQEVSHPCMRKVNKHKSNYFQMWLMLQTLVPLYIRWP